MFLAEDRILCLKIYTTPNKKWTLAYICNAFAVVDPVVSLLGMLVFTYNLKIFLNYDNFIMLYIYRYILTIFTRDKENDGLMALILL